MGTGHKCNRVRKRDKRGGLDDPDGRMATRHRFLSTRGKWDQSVGLIQTSPKKWEQKKEAAMSCSVSPIHLFFSFPFPSSSLLQWSPTCPLPLSNPNTHRHPHMSRHESTWMTGRGRDRGRAWRWFPRQALQRLDFLQHPHSMSTPLPYSLTCSLSQSLLLINLSFLFPFVLFFSFSARRTKKGDKGYYRC